MVDYIESTIAGVRDRTVIIQMGAFGLSVAVPNPLNFQVGVCQKLYLHMHWNQEQGPTLYGFSHEYERTIFLLVISCSGIGPKIGLAVLSSIGPQQCVQAIQEENPKLLAQVPGIGLKKAEQIIVQLKHKLDELSVGIDISVAKSGNDWHSVTQALESLNYSRFEISAAVQHVRNKQQEGLTAPFDVLLRQALSFLAKQV